MLKEISQEGGVWVVRFDYGREHLGGGACSVRTNWTPAVPREETAWRIAKEALELFPDATDIGVFKEWYEQGENGACAMVRTQSTRFPVLRRTWNAGIPIPGPGWPLRVRARGCLRRWWARCTK